MTYKEIKEKLPEFGEVGENALLIIQLLEIQIQLYEKLVEAWKR